MAFRMGSFRGKGAVYSRRRVGGASGKVRAFRDKPSIIYEESEEDSEVDVPKPIVQITDQRTIAAVSSRAVLKDKSNVTRTPKRQSERHRERSLEERQDSSQNRRARIPDTGLQLSASLNPSILEPSTSRSSKEQEQNVFPPLVEEDIDDDDENDVANETTMRGRIDALYSAAMKSKTSIFNIGDIPDTGKLPQRSSQKQGSTTHFPRVKPLPSSDYSRPETKARHISPENSFDDMLTKSKVLCKETPRSNTTSDKGRTSQRFDLTKSNSRFSKATTSSEGLVPLSPSEMAQWLAQREKDRIRKAELEAEERRAFKNASRGVELDDDERDKTEMGIFEFGDWSTADKSYMTIQGIEQVFVDEESVSDVVEIMQVQDNGITDSMKPHGARFPGTEIIEETFPESPFPPNETISETHSTPHQNGPFNIAPPAVRKPFQLWNLTRNIDPSYITSPSPATDMNTEDFVMLRRKKGSLVNFDEPDILQHRPEPKPSKPKLEAKGKHSKKKVQTNGNTKGQGNKWVKFLDVALTCPSDESDDELAFCKPSWTKKTEKN